MHTIIYIDPPPPDPVPIAYVISGNFSVVGQWVKKVAEKTGAHIVIQGYESGQIEILHVGDVLSRREVLNEFNASKDELIRGVLFTLPFIQ